MTSVVSCLPVRRFHGLRLPPSFDLAKLMERVYQVTIVETFEEKHTPLLFERS